MAVPGTPELKSALKKSDDAPKYFVVRALDKFAPKSKDELPFDKKDLILVLEENPAEGKFRGEVIKGGKIKNEKTGWFPSFYVRKEPNEKLPELPASLQPKKRADTKVEMKIPPPTTPGGASSARRSSTPVVAEDSTAKPPAATPTSKETPRDGAEQTERQPSLSDMRKRFGGSRSTTIRTLKLTNDEADAEEEEPEADEPEETPEELADSSKDKGVYMQRVASLMVSKLAFMQTKKKPAAKEPPANSSTLAPTPNKGDKDKDKAKAGIFSSLRKSKEPRASTGDDRASRKAQSAPASATGTAEKERSKPVPVPSAASIQARLSQAGSDVGGAGISTSAESPPIISVTPSVDSLQMSPRASEAAGNMGLRQSKSAVELPSDTNPKSPGFESMPARSGSVRQRKGSVRAQIVEEDMPAPQAAAVQQFNPEGKNIEILGEIGKGATSTVWKGSIDGEFVALKQISLMNVKNPRAMRTALKDEVEMMKAFNHPNILKYHAMFYSRVNQEINIVLEMVEGLPVAKLITKQKALAEPIAAQIIYQLLDALKFLVRQNVVHRDVKPQNLLVSMEGIVKLIDFGTVAKLSAAATHRNSTVGTPWYVAPEVIAGDDYSYTADVWSVGCTLLELVTGKPPYHDQNSVAALFKMVEEPHPPLPTNVSKECTDFLVECFKRDHKTRAMAHTCQELAFVKNRTTQAELSKIVQQLSSGAKPDDGGFDF